MTPTLTTKEQQEAFQRDGFIVVSGLLDANVLAKLVKSGDIIMDHNTGCQINPYFEATHKGVALNGPAVTMSEKYEQFVTESFRNVALYSKMPQVAAELMGFDQKSKDRNVRILRDVFLGKGIKSPRSCQWHVDDPSVWPESYLSTGGYGINAWIALADFPAGGSLGLASGSHTADWRHRAYEALGQDHTSPGQSKEELLLMLERGTLPTCTMEDRIDRELFDAIEATAVYPDMKRGDIIFHTRWLFHKTTGLPEEGKAWYRQKGLTSLNRYSVRYVAGKATLPTGFVNELSVFSNPENAGRTLDEITELDGPWYPQVWPSVESNFAEAMEVMAETKLPAAYASAKAASAELVRFVSSPPDLESE